MERNMSSSIIDRISITTAEECYCAICGVPFQGFLFQNKEQAAGTQPPGVRDGVQHGYNPTVVTIAEASAWIDKVHILGYDAEGDVAFISGQGQYTSPRTITLDRQDKRNSNVPFWLGYSCYRKSGNAVVVFPFHWPCYEVFARALFPTAKNPVSLVDVEDVQSLFSSLSNDENGLTLETGAETRYGRP
ncbi:hypothetical protein F5Y05DRAFT_380686 [Hypoxylon sp. FL0543]|nr:hypothetical protein F5Y05DRAFT_380686 [Hypoxylon sp. FL0543]